jgi:type I restriction enzyme S subunit
MELKPGYKKTEVGVIPEDWVVSSVGEKGQVVAGKALAVNAPGKQRPYLRTKNVFDGRIDIEDVLSMPMTDEQFSQFQLRHGDVLLNEGQSLELVGRCSIYKEEYPEPCAIQNALLRFRANIGTSASFTSHLFRHCQQTGVFAKIALQTTSVAHLGSSRFANLKLAWPTENEQRLIAAALDEIDALLGSLEAAITKKTSLKQAAMQELLTGKRRLPGFEGEWEVKRLGEIGSTFGGLTGKTKSDFGNGDAHYVTFMNVMMNVEVNCECFERVRVASNESQNRVLRGDLLFNGSSETPDEVAMCSFLTKDVSDLYLNSFCFGYRLRADAPVSGLFLAYLIRSDVGREVVKSLAQGSTRYNLSKSALLDAAIQLPNIGEQTAIATVLSDMDNELASLEDRLGKARELKQGMMQQLLTGKIRLK